MTETLTQRRARLLGPNMSTFYDDPVHLVRGAGVHVWDADGRQYLDCYNNVPHVGHCHPKVVEAICRQAGTLNTHTRYLHEGILDYVEALVATFDAPFDTALMACTGSEANDVALRMAQAVTGKTGVIATDHTYHGNTTAVHQLSQTNPPPGGYWDSVCFVPAPDSYRPLGGTPGMAHAQAFADAVAAQIAVLEERGHGFSSLIIDPFFANEGFPDLPQGWLDPVQAVVKKAGGVIIADEVQPGFGRVGTHFWGHQKIGLKPDIVTMGKPMGNGLPIAAMAARAAVLDDFARGVPYFNTFGGNPVSCAAAMAVLEEIEDNGLVENARVVGEHARGRLETLKQKYEFIGDVRGSGLIFGAEMVLDRETKEPASDFTDRVINAMRHRGVIHSKLGRHKNTLKIRPPLPFSIENADLLFDTLDDVLSNTPLHT